MIYCFDLDGTLCTNTNGNYESAEPFYDRINVVNGLYENGDTILIDTARGSTTGINWYNFTESQLLKWGVKFHTLRTGIKFNFDLLIDDKSVNDNFFFDKK
jgi:hypothetical protein